MPTTSSTEQPQIIQKWSFSSSLTTDICGVSQGLCESNEKMNWFCLRTSFFYSFTEPLWNKQKTTQSVVTQTTATLSL